MNPKWKHFSEICASDLLLLDDDDPAPTLEDDQSIVDKSAWCIQGAVHKINPKARIVLHLHPPYATALASLQDPTLYPIDLNTARFFGMGVDNAFAGMADLSKTSA